MADQTGLTLDGFRHVLERLPPDLYLRLDYFDEWTRAPMVTAVDEGESQRRMIAHEHMCRHVSSLFSACMPYSRPAASRDASIDATRACEYTQTVHSYPPRRMRHACVDRRIRGADPRGAPRADGADPRPRRHEDPMCKVRLR